MPSVPAASVLWILLLPPLRKGQIQSLDLHIVCRLRDLVLKWLPVTNNAALDGGNQGEGDSPIRAVLRSKALPVVMAKASASETSVASRLASCALLGALAPRLTREEASGLQPANLSQQKPGMDAFTDQVSDTMAEICRQSTCTF